jgi:6-phosphogluconolactonase
MKTAVKYKPNLEILSDYETLSRRSAEVFIADALKAINVKDAFYVAISGGTEPKRFFEMLAELPKAKALPWDKIQLFWVDERYVPPDSQWSNYKLAADTFLSKVSISKENIHRIPTEGSDFLASACRYEQIIREVFGIQENKIPEFDLIVLGMGVDGHTGSLFPGSYACFDTEDLACVVYVLGEKFHSQDVRRINRITLTHPVLRAAFHLAVLVSGEEKAGILKKVLTSEPDEVLYPIHTIWPVLDKVTWLIDRDAAKEI